MSDRKAMVPIPAGALFTVSVGEYSDYHIKGVFRARAEVDAERLLAEWLQRHPGQRESHQFHHYNFFEWVAVALGLAEPVECWEWHLADYAGYDEMTVEKVGEGKDDD